MFMPPKVQYSLQLGQEPCKEVSKDFLNGYICNEIPSPLPGTCDWIFDEPSFRTWLTGSECPFLWITGCAGVGKSVLLSFIARRLQKSETITAFWFCNSALKTTSSVSQILQTIIYAILKQRSRNVSHTSFNSSDVRLYAIFASLVATSTTKMSQSNIRNHFQTILDCLMLEESISLILDGINEGDGSERLFVEEVYWTYTWKKTPHLKCIFSSRAPIESSLWFTGISKIDLETEGGVQIALHSFAAMQVTKLARKIPGLKLHRKLLLEKLCVGRKGTFLWMKLVTNYLLEKMLGTISAVESIIDSMASSLYACYDQLLQAISHENQVTAQKVFLWMLYSVRPLHISELRTALAIQHTPFTSKKMPGISLQDQPLEHLEGDITRLTNGLVTVQKNHYVCLVHISVQEYLLSKSSETNFQGHSSSYTRAHDMIAQSCLRFLMYRTSPSIYSINNGSSTNQSIQNNSFENYAKEHWPVHCRLVKDQSDSLPRLLDHFLVVEGNYSSQLNASGQLTEKPLELALRVCSQYGFEPLGKVYIQMGTDVSAPSLTSGLTPLQLAVANGHLEVVKMLLTMGASLNSKGPPHGISLLHYAAINGHVEVMELLLKRGIDVNSRSEYGETPLHVAVAHGESDATKLLIDHGGDINFTTNYSQQTALHLAASKGYIEDVIYLLGGRIRNNLGTELTLPQSFTSSGHPAQSQGQHFNCDKWFTLDKELSYRNYESILWLLESCVSIEAKDRHGCTALHLAAKIGYIRIVQLLVKRGAHVRTTNEVGQTPLNSAASNGRFEVVKLLLEKGADLAIPNNSGWTPLSSAASNGHLEVVKLLLEKGADVAVLCNSGWTPLDLANTNGHADVVQLLLRHGAQSCDSRTTDPGPIDSMQDILISSAERSRDMDVRNVGILRTAQNADGPALDPHAKTYPSTVVLEEHYATDHSFHSSHQAVRAFISELEGDALFDLYPGAFMNVSSMTYPCSVNAQDLLSYDYTSNATSLSSVEADSLSTSQELCNTKLEDTEGTGPALGFYHTVAFDDASGILTSQGSWTTDMMDPSAEYTLTPQHTLTLRPKNKAAPTTESMDVEVADEMGWTILG